MLKNDLIKKTAQMLFDKMEITCQSIELEEKPDSPILVLNVQIGEMGGQLIGQGGANLEDLQRLLRLMVAKKDIESPSFILDINGYRQKRDNFLRDFAQELADQVIKTKEPSILRPMSSYERRIIHLELADYQGITTESTGEGRERRLIIKPVV